MRSVDGMTREEMREARKRAREQAAARRRTAAQSRVADAVGGGTPPATPVPPVPPPRPRVDLDAVGWHGDPAELIEVLATDPFELLAAILPPRPDWHALAACRGHPREWWFPKVGESTNRAVAICNSCTVRDVCRAAAIADPELDGVWGGTAPRRRRALRNDTETGP